MLFFSFVCIKLDYVEIDRFDDFPLGKDFFVVILEFFGKSGFYNRGIDRYSAVIDYPFASCALLVFYELNCTVKTFAMFL